MEQDGLRTDVRAPVSGWTARLAMARPASRIVLRTLLLADAGLLVVVGALLALFMQAPEGVLFASGCWTLAAVLGVALRAVRDPRPTREEWAAPAPRVKL